MSDDLRTDAPDHVTDEQKARSARLEMMRKIVRSIIDSEERDKRGMRWDEIVNLPGLKGSNPKKAVEDLLALKYLVCTTVRGLEETSGDVRINRLCELYGTTFFGRKWLMELEKDEQT